MVATKKDVEGLLSYDRTSGRYLLNVLLWCMHVTTFVNIVFTSQIPGHSLRNMIGSAVGFSGSLLARFFWMRHREHIGVHVLSAIFVVAAIGAAMGNGIHVPGVVGIFVGVAMTGYLLGIRWAAIYASIGVTALWGAYFLEIIRPRPIQDVPAFAWGAVLVILLLLTCVIVSIPARGILLAYDKFQKERRSLANSIHQREERSRNLERDVQARTSNLALANADLERFPLALAHDLRTPLQALSGFASLLEESGSDVVQASALQELQNSIRTMELVLNRTLEVRRRQRERSDG